MALIQKIEILEGVHWVAIAEADLYLLCGCPEDAVKYLIQKGLITTLEQQGVICESGPNAILLSDVMLQNGMFSNLAEFPVLQMFYRQGMLLPDHPNNTGIRPLLIGSEQQVKVQMDYIYRGNYGLCTETELLEAGMTPEQARDWLRLKLKFAFGTIHPSEDLLDSIILDECDPTPIRGGVTIQRECTNQFVIHYGDEQVRVDLTRSLSARNHTPYPLGFQQLNREFFAVVHSGQGDGWDVNRPCMSSILMYQGKLYLIDAGPNIDYTLMALGISINEIEGIFHTHGHDDHFAGLTTLVRGDHRLKYFATPLVRNSVFAKLGALLSVDPRVFFQYFDVQDLQFDRWNDIDGLEVKPFLSPHPVETSIFSFRTFWEGRYLTYSHLADIVSLEVLHGWITDNPEEPGVSQAFYDRVKSEYLAPADLKKLDIGAGMIHGQAEDFRHDPSGQIILAHTSIQLTQYQKEIGSSAPFGVIDVLIPDYSNQFYWLAHQYLSAFFPEVPLHSLRMLLNNEIERYNPGTLLIKKSMVNETVYLVLSGNIEAINAQHNILTLISAGGMVGEYSGLRSQPSPVSYRTISYVRALKIPARSYLHFVRSNRLLIKLERLKENREFLQQTQLFDESISPPIYNRIAEAMHLYHYDQTGVRVDLATSGRLLLIKKGRLEHRRGGRVIESIGPGGHYRQVGLEGQNSDHLQVAEPASLYALDLALLQDIPIVQWKLLESDNLRLAMQ